MTGFQYKDGAQNSMLAVFLFYSILWWYGIIFLELSYR